MLNQWPMAVVAMLDAYAMALLWLGVISCLVRRELPLWALWAHTLVGGAAVHAGAWTLFHLDPGNELGRDWVELGVAGYVLAVAAPLAVLAVRALSRLVLRLGDAGELVTS